MLLSFRIYNEIQLYRDCGVCTDSNEVYPSQYDAESVLVCLDFGWMDAESEGNEVEDEVDK